MRTRKQTSKQASKQSKPLFSPSFMYHTIIPTLPLFLLFASSLLLSLRFSSFVDNDSCISSWFPCFCPEESLCNTGRLTRVSVLTVCCFLFFLFRFFFLIKRGSALASVFSVSCEHRTGMDWDRRGEKGDARFHASQHVKNREMGERENRDMGKCIVWSWAMLVVWSCFVFGLMWVGTEASVFEGESQRASNRQVVFCRCRYWYRRVI